MKKRKIIVFLLLALLATLIMAVPGSARAVKETMAEKSAYCAILEYGNEWYSAGKIWHLRDRVVYKSTVPLLSYGGQPDSEGWTTVVINLNLNLETGSGNAWGTWVREFDNFDGAYEGMFAGGFTDGVWSGRVNGKGSGVYEGYHVKGFQQDIPDVDALPEGGDPCPDGAIDGTPGGILLGYTINTKGD